MNHKDIEARKKAEARAEEIKRKHPAATAKEIAEQLTFENHINPATGESYTAHSVRLLLIGEGALDYRYRAEARAKELKLSGLTYNEVMHEMADEGWVNPRTKKPYGGYTIRMFSLGLADQRGGSYPRKSKHGKTPEERAAYWREYYREYSRKYREQNREKARQYGREYRRMSNG